MSEEKKKKFVYVVKEKYKFLVEYDKKKKIVDEIVEKLKPYLSDLTYTAKYRENYITFYLESADFAKMAEDTIYEEYDEYPVIFFEMGTKLNKDTDEHKFTLFEWAIAEALAEIIGGTTEVRRVVTEYDTRYYLMVNYKNEAWIIVKKDYEHDC